MGRNTVELEAKIWEQYLLPERLTHQQIADRCGCSRRKVQYVIAAEKNKKGPAPQSTAPNSSTPDQTVESSSNATDFTTDSPDRAETPDLRPAI